jgi:multidrug efflux pump subunit AcrA (membrane-fusion protein)
MLDTFNRQSRVSRMMAVVLGAIVVGIVVLAILPKKKETMKETPRQSISVKTVPVCVSDLPDVATYPARVEAAMDHAVEVRAEFNALAAAVGLRRKSPGELPKPPPWIPPGS